MQNLVSLALTWNGDLHDCVGRPVGHAEYVDGEVYPPVLVVAVGEVVLHVLPESRVDVSAQLHVLWAEGLTVTSLSLDVPGTKVVQTSLGAPVL